MADVPLAKSAPYPAGQAFAAAASGSLNKGPLDPPFDPYASETNYLLGETGHRPRQELA